MGPAGKVMSKSVSRIYTELVLAESKKKSRKKTSIRYAHGFSFCTGSRIHTVVLLGKCVFWVKMSELLI